MKNTPKKTAHSCRDHKKACCHNHNHHNHHGLCDKFLRSIAPGSLMPIDIIDITPIASKNLIDILTSKLGYKEFDFEKDIAKLSHASRAIFDVITDLSKFDFSNTSLAYKRRYDLDKKGGVFAYDVSCVVKNYNEKIGTDVISQAIVTVYIYPDPNKTIDEFDKAFSKIKSFQLPLKSLKPTCDKKANTKNAVKVDKSKKTKKPSNTEKTKKPVLKFQKTSEDALTSSYCKEKPLFKDAELKWLLIGESSYKISKDALDVKYVSFDTKNQRYVYNISLIDKKNEMHYLILNIYKKRLSKDLIIKKFDKFVEKVDTFLKK